jgi:hypothetical protein
MGRRKNRKNEELPRDEHLPLPSRIQRTGATISWVIVAVGTVLGVIVGVLSFVPRVTIVPAGMSDPDNPYSVAFNITNSSPMLITLNDVNVRVSLGQVINELVPFKPIKKFIDTNSGMTMADWHGHKLTVDQTYTVTLEHMFGVGKVPPYNPTRLSGADLAIVVEYRPWILPWHRTQIQRFVTDKNSDGKLYWYSFPLE